MTKTITIYAKEFKTKEGKPFLSYSTKIGDVWYKIKFRRECDIFPKRPGKFNATVDPNNCSLQKSDKGYNDIIWIKQLEGFDRIERTNEENPIADIFEERPF